jgi:hypothetical protein
MVRSNEAFYGIVVLALSRHPPPLVGGAEYGGAVLSISANVTGKHSIFINKGRSARAWTYEPEKMVRSKERTQRQGRGDCMHFSNIVPKAPEPGRMSLKKWFGAMKHSRV